MWCIRVVFKIQCDSHLFCVYFYVRGRKKTATAAAAGRVKNGRQKKKKLHKWKLRKKLPQKKNPSTDLVARDSASFCFRTRAKINRRNVGHGFSVSRNAISSAKKLRSGTPRAKNIPPKRHCPSPSTRRVFLNTLSYAGAFLARRARSPKGSRGERRPFSKLSSVVERTDRPKDDSGIPEIAIGFVAEFLRVPCARAYVYVYERNMYVSHTHTHTHECIKYAY